MNEKQRRALHSGTCRHRPTSGHTRLYVNKPQPSHLPSIIYRYTDQAAGLDYNACVTVYVSYQPVWFVSSTGHWGAGQSAEDLGTEGCVRLLR